LLELIVAHARLGLSAIRSAAQRNIIACAARFLSGISSAQQPRRFQRRTIRGQDFGASDGSALISLLLLTFVLMAFVTVANRANATWKPEYANAAPEVQEWYRTAQLTDTAQMRFGFKSCCAHSDVVKTSFRVNKGTSGDEWYWRNGDQWTLIPGDIIHWGESAPDRQPTLFAIGNLPTCFFPGQGDL
jgi:hypothetical protein